MLPPCPLPIFLPLTNELTFISSLDLRKLGMKSHGILNRMWFDVEFCTLWMNSGAGMKTQCIPGPR